MGSSNLHSFVRAHLRAAKRCGRGCWSRHRCEIPCVLLELVVCSVAVDSSTVTNHLFSMQREKRGTLGGGGSDEGEQGGVGGGDSVLEAAAAAALTSPSPSLPPALLKLMLLNNTICRHIVEGKSSAVLSASGAVFDLHRHHYLRYNVTITPLSEALLQLDAVSIASAAPATTCDAVLYNTALALMQGGGSGHAVAFTVLARCSHLQVSRGRFTQPRVAVEPACMTYIVACALCL